MHCLLPIKSDPPFCVRQEVMVLLKTLGRRGWVRGHKPSIPSMLYICFSAFLQERGACLLCHCLDSESMLNFLKNLTLWMSQASNDNFHTYFHLSWASLGVSGNHSLHAFQNYKVSGRLPNYKSYLNRIKIFSLKPKTVLQSPTDIFRVESNSPFSKPTPS